MASLPNKTGINLKREVLAVFIILSVALAIIIELFVPLVKSPLHPMLNITI